MFIGINFYFDLDTFTLLSDSFCTQVDSLHYFALCQTKVGANRIYARSRVLIYFVLKLIVCTILRCP